MITRVSKRGFGFALVSLLLLSGLYSAPSHAQQPFICNSTVTPTTPDTVAGGFPWDGAVHRWSCTGVEVETKREITATCPQITCVRMWDYIRARRQTVPGARVVSAQAFDSPNQRCNLNPASTAWTSWCVVQSAVGQVIAPPGQIRLIGVTVAQ